MTQHASRFAVSLLPALAVFVVCCAGPRLVRGQSVDERFLEGLRQRRLFSLAESYCLEKLSDSSLVDARRAELVVELSRTYTEHALHSTATAADPLWKQAVEVTYDFSRRSPDSRRDVLVKTQAALVLLARGELARQQSEVLADNEKLLEEARGYLRMAIRQLTETANQISQRLRQTGRPAENDLTRDQLLSLERNVRYQLARGYRNQGQAYPAHSPDRANSLSQAVELLGPLAQISVADPFAWQCRLEEIACLRLLKDYAAAFRRLENLEQQKPPAPIALRARAEQMRLTIASGRIEAALAMVEAGGEAAGSSSPELDLATVEVYASAWRAAEQQNDPAAAKRWQAQAAHLASRIQQLHGAYWSRRAESLLAGQVSTSTLPTSDLDLLVRAAESHYRGGDFLAAVEGYDRAAALANEHKEPARAFELGYAAASVEHEQKQHRAAADRFRRLAIDQPQEPRAGDAHLLAIFNAAQEARRRPTPQLDEYVALLDEHLRLWPKGKSAEQAYWLLGRVRQHEGDCEAAIAAYRHVSPEHSQFLPAIDGMETCYLRWIAQLDAEGKPTRDVILAAARYFEGLFVSSEGRLPERWSSIERAAALGAARVWLAAAPPEYERPRQFLSAAMSDADDAPAAWKSTAAALLVTALAGQGELAAARDQLKAVGNGSATELLALVESLAAMSEKAKPQTSPQIAALRLDALTLLEPRRGELDERDRLRLDRLAAQTLAAAGDTAEARQRYAQLARQHPRDGQIQEDYALLLSNDTDKASLEAALAKWRELEQKSPTATPRWFRSKYYLALTHERLGNKAQAAKIVELTRVLHPDLGGAALKAQFLDLLARCK